MYLSLFVVHTWSQQASWKVFKYWPVGKSVARIAIDSNLIVVIPKTVAMQMGFWKSRLHFIFYGEFFRSVVWTFQSNNSLVGTRAMCVISCHLSIRNSCALCILKNSQFNVEWKRKNPKSHWQWKTIRAMGITSNL